MPVLHHTSPTANLFAMCCVQLCYTGSNVVYAVNGRSATSFTVYAELLWICGEVCVWCTAPWALQ